MKRRYKLLLIILLGCLITIIIYFSATSTNKNIVALGDGLSLGMTPYHVAGLSFNDYLRDYLENRHDLASFNQEFCAEHLTIDKLNTYLEKLVKEHVFPGCNWCVITKDDTFYGSVGYKALKPKKITNDINNLYDIAREYNTSVSAIKSLNNLDSNDLDVGQILKIRKESV